jgi:hypothetical protein
MLGRLNYDSTRNPSRLATSHWFPPLERAASGAASGSSGITLGLLCSHRELELGHGGGPEAVRDPAVE